MPGNILQQITPWAVYRHFIYPLKARNLNVSKKVLITGGNAGIGRETLIQMMNNAKKDDKIEITICARNGVTINETIIKLSAIAKSKGIKPQNAKFFYEKLDLSSKNDCIRLAKKLKNRSFDVWINNAGLIPPSLYGEINYFML